MSNLSIFRLFFEKPQSSLLKAPTGMSDHRPALPRSGTPSERGLAEFRYFSERALDVCREKQQNSARPSRIDV